MLITQAKEQHMVSSCEKVEMKMTSSVYKFKMAARQNLTRMKSCCFSIGWHFLIVLQYGKDKTNA